MTAQAQRASRTIPTRRRRRSSKRGTNMTKEELRELWVKYKDTESDELRNRLIEHYLPLVRLHAEKMKNALPKRVDIADLVAEGCIGLINAVERFDLSRENTFETYCAARIRGAILDYLRESDWVPRPIRRRWNLLGEARRRLFVTLGREPTHDELAREIGLDMHDLHKWLSEAGEIKVQVSLEGACSEEDRDMLHLEMLADENDNTPVRRVQLREVLEDTLPTLPKREQDVIHMYYCRTMTMKEIGRVMGLSESRVCQIHNHAIQCLRGRLGLNTA